MYNPIKTQWGKDVKIALVNKEMSVIQFGKGIGVRPAVLSQLMHGRYAGKDFDNVVEKINSELGTQGKPPRPKLSAEWRKAAMDAMNQVVGEDVYKLKVNELADEIGFSRDRVSLVINGKTIDEPVIEAISKKLNIECPALAYE